MTTATIKMISVHAIRSGDTIAMMPANSRDAKRIGRAHGKVNAILSSRKLAAFVAESAFATSPAVFEMVESDYVELLQS